MGSWPGARRKSWLCRVLSAIWGRGGAWADALAVAYNVAIDPRTPTWARGSLFAALAYFGLPIDAVPDMTPFVGFTDDAAILAAALVAVAAHIRWRHVRQARHTMRTWGIRTEDPKDDPDDDDTAYGFS